MLDSITNFENPYWINQQSKLNQIKSDIKINKDKSKSFDQLLNEKLNKDGNINQNKLNKNEKKLYDSCVELESFFWKQVLNSMKKTTGQYKLLDGGQAEEIFSDLLYDQYSLTLSRNSNSGIANDIFKQLSTYL